MFITTGITQNMAIQRYCLPILAFLLETILSKTAATQDRVGLSVEWKSKKQQVPNSSRQCLITSGVSPWYPNDDAIIKSPFLMVKSPWNHGAVPLHWVDHQGSFPGWHCPGGRSGCNSDRPCFWNWKPNEIHSSSPKFRSMALQKLHSSTTPKSPKNSETLKMGECTECTLRIPEKWPFYWSKPWSTMEFWGTLLSNKAIYG